MRTRQLSIPLAASGAGASATFRVAGMLSLAAVVLLAALALLFLCKSLGMLSVVTAWNG